MMSKRIFTFIFPSSLIVILFSIGVISWVFSDFFRDYYLDMTKERLRTNAFAMRSAVVSALSEDKSQKLSGLVEDLAKNTQTRITVVGIDGKVLADSNENPIEMENHATPNRKEILNAIKGEIGYSVRYSSTLAKDTMYVAVPIHENNKVIAVIRTSFFLDTLHQFLNKTYSHIIGWAVVVATVAICISYVISKQISNPLEKLKSTAAQFAKGDFSVKTPESSIVEIKALSESMNTMSTALQDNINEITQQKNELKLILSNMLEGVIAVDLDDKIITMNRAAKKILNTNIPITSSIGDGKVENALFNYPQKDNDEKYESGDFRKTILNKDIHDLIDEVMNSSQTVNRKVELTGITPKIIDVHGAVLRNFSCSTIGVLLVVSDITQILQLENMRKNFAANVSHELKTPLTAIKGAVETLIDGALHNEDDANNFLRIIYKHSERLNALINDIMSLSRIEQEKTQNGAEFTSCSLKQIIETALEVCQDKADNSNVAIKINCGERLNVSGIEQMLEQVFINLIDNAVKFSPENEEVSVNAYLENDRVSIDVIDHGCGIPEEHIPRLFERFYRVDKGRSRQQGGTGLGLSIVKHIVNSHKGTVEVESDPGKVTVFTVKLPFVISEA